jgi:hypothetical protein
MSQTLPVILGGLIEQVWKAIWQCGCSGSVLMLSGRLPPVQLLVLGQISSMAPPPRRGFSATGRSGRSSALLPGFRIDIPYAAIGAAHGAPMSNLLRGSVPILPMSRKMSVKCRFNAHRECPQTAPLFSVGDTKRSPTVIPLLKKRSPGDRQNDRRID